MKNTVETSLFDVFKPIEGLTSIQDFKNYLQNRYGNDVKIKYKFLMLREDKGKVFREFQIWVKGKNCKQYSVDSLSYHSGKFNIKDCWCMGIGNVLYLGFIYYSLKFKRKVKYV